MSKDIDGVSNKLIENEMRTSFLNYSMSVITSRALPDARDGLKPVHRRILYSMWEQKMFSNSGFYKSARIVGDVMGKYHPHGDSSIYDAMVRLGQPWSVATTLIDKQGNFGSMDGDGAAAMRYTEAKMSKIAEEMLVGINKESVPFVENYDGKEKEPSVLPSKFPNLLVNGGQGIAVGMASNMPTHNLVEICNAMCEYIKNPNLTIDELMEIVPGPDFPTGALVYGTEGIKKAYETGSGSFTIRGKVSVEESSDGTSLVISQVPYQVGMDLLYRKIRDVQTIYDDYRRSIRGRKNQKFIAKKPNKAMDFIKQDGLNNESGKDSTEDNVKLVIRLKDGVEPQVVINHLFKYTPLQTSFSINNTVLVPDEAKKLKPMRIGMLRLMEEYLKHEVEVTRAELNYDLNKNKRELHQIDALIKALDKLEDVLYLIRNSETNKDAVAGLKKLLKIDDAQAAFILDKRIRSLTGAQQNEAKERNDFLVNEIKRLKELLSDDELVKGLIADHLNLIKDTYGRERRTEIGGDLVDLTSEDLIQNERVVVTLSNNGYIKSTRESRYRSQRRNGRGVNTMNLDKDDFLLHLEIMNKHDNLLVLTNLGKVYKLKGYDIPESVNVNRGTHIHNLLPGIEDGEVIQSVLSIKEFSDKQNLFFVTSSGIVKKTKLSEYENIHRNGIYAISLDKGNRLVNVTLTDQDSNIIIITQSGQSISFKETDVKSTSRNTRGVIGINLSKGDKVVGSDINEEFADIFIVSENGYGKKTPMNEFKIQKRGGKGVLALKKTEKTGNIISSITMTDDDNIFVLSSMGSMIKIKSTQIFRYKRVAQGTRVINLREGDKVKVTARLPEEMDDTEE